MNKKDNPLIEVIGDIDIRERNNLNITLNQYEYARLVRIYVETGKSISMAKIIALLSKPCQNCGQNCATISIPKGILSTKKGATGGNLSSHKKST